jgi:hypothetical protein
MFSLPGVEEAARMLAHSDPSRLMVTVLRAPIKDILNGG